MVVIPVLIEFSKVAVAGRPIAGCGAIRAVVQEVRNSAEVFQRGSESHFGHFVKVVLVYGAFRVSEDWHWGFPSCRLY